MDTPISIIQQLKENKVPFSLMSKEMQDELILTGTIEDTEKMVVGVDRSVKWCRMSIRPSKASYKDLWTTFRLRPDYQEEEYERCEYKTKMVGEDYYIEGYMHGGQFVPMSHVPDGYVRAGYLYEDDKLRVNNMYYLDGHHYYEITSMENLKSGITVVRPTHIVFRKQP